VAKRTASARKQMRADVDRAARNKSARSAIKTRVVRVRRAIVEHSEGLAELGLAAISSLDRAANKGILHSNNAARRKSRLMKALNSTEGATAEAAPKAPRAKAAPARTAAAPKKAAPAKKAIPAKPAGRAAAAKKSTPAKARTAAKKK
jgi:small subunit ribosomal protein S20